MKLSPARFVSIDGTNVQLNINNDKEAKIALTELRHKRKELTLIKRKLQAEQKLVRQKNTAQGRRLSGFTLANSVARLIGLGGGIGRIGSAARAMQRLDLERKLSPTEDSQNAIDETILNIDSAILFLTTSRTK